MLLNKKDLFSFFDYFYNKVHGTNFKLSASPKNEKYAESFFTLIKKEYEDTVGKEFLFTYFLFQFQYWDKLEITNNSSFSNTIQLSFIIGKKAFERYISRDKNYDWQFESLPIIKKYGLRKTDLIEQLSTKHKTAVKKGIDTEAPIKLAFYNTPEGYDVCQDYSTLYNHKSSICNGCSFTKDCKELLKKQYPSLYIDRGY